MKESSIQSEAEEETVTASSMLRAAREALGLSQDDVANALYLTVSFIRWIDEDQIDRIPQKAFIKGYLRSYAKLVKLDGDLVVQQFDAGNEVPIPSAEIRGVTEESVGSINFTGPVFKTGVIGLVGLLVVIVAVWLLSSSTPEPIPVVTMPEESPAETESETLRPFQLPERTDLNTFTFDEEDGTTGSAESVLLPESEGAETETVVLSDSEAAETESDLSTEDEVVNDEPTPDIQPQLPQASVLEKDISIQRQTVGDTDYITVDAEGLDQLRFVFSDECWLEIEDADGALIYGDLGRTGDELSVYGDAPFEILFGKAPAVTMEFNGRSVDLASWTASDQTAKVTVGR
mgnify:CR=1 FL=1